MLIHGLVEIVVLTVGLVSVFLVRGKLDIAIEGGLDLPSVHKNRSIGCTFASNLVKQVVQI